MAKITLNNGMTVLVDADDFKRLTTRLDQYGNLKTKRWTYDGRYAVNKLSPVHPKMYLHRVVLNVADPNLHVDHLNGNRLDCRKKNLRIVTKVEHHRRHGASHMHTPEIVARSAESRKRNGQANYFGRDNLTAEERSEAARHASRARWG